MRRLATALIALATTAGVLVSGTADAVEDVVPEVPTPTVFGPVPHDLGLKGEAWFDPPFALEEAQPIAYTSEEFFLDGVARDIVTEDGLAEDAPYRTRMLVVRPADMNQFSGAVIIEWDNVTAQAALNPLWMWDHPYLMREGHVFVSVSAQKVGVDGPSPLAHTQWDPPRYSTLLHPGDAHSYDIFVQAAQALRTNALSSPTTIDGQGLTGGHAVLGDVVIDDGTTPVTTTPGKSKGKDNGKNKGKDKGTGDPVGTTISIIATGTSQSSSRLVNLLDYAEGITVDNIDGYLLDAGGRRTFSRPLADPTVDFDSEDQLGAATPSVDGESLLVGATETNYRLWEVPGASHADAEFSRYIEDGLYLTHILEAPELSWAEWDARRVDFRYGDEGPGLRTTCQPLGYGDNTYPRRYAARAAMHQLIEWVQSGDGSRAVQHDRVAYAGSSPQRDAEGQIVGGVRLPQIDVPIADYQATTCGLFGNTVTFDPLKLAALYPTTTDYVTKMEAAIARALTAGAMLPAEAAELRTQLGTAVIPSYRTPESPGDLDGNAAHFGASLLGLIG